LAKSADVRGYRERFPERMIFEPGLGGGLSRDGKATLEDC